MKRTKHITTSLSALVIGASAFFLPACTSSPKISPLERGKEVMESALNNDLEKRTDDLYCESTVETEKRSIGNPGNPFNIFALAFSTQITSDPITTGGKGSFVRFGSTRVMNTEIPYTLVGELTGSKKVREVSLKNLYYFGIFQIGSTPIARLNNGVYIPSIGNLCILSGKETEEYPLDDPKVKPLIDLAHKIREKYQIE